MTDRRLTLAWAQKLYKEHGISFFPMSTEAKRPLIRTSEWWGKHFPVDALARFPGCNIAAQTGLHTRLIVVDVDNVPAASAWFKAHPVLPATWSVRTGGGGLHLWFKVPDWWTNEFGRTQVWKGEGKHEEIGVIFGRGMAVCPPSRFKGSGPYRWEVDRSPLHRSLGIAPEWFLKMCVALKEVKAEPMALGTFPVGSSAGQWGDFSGLVPDKLSLLVSWGLRLAGGMNTSGWIPCHRPGEEDTVASGSVRPDTGQVWTSTRGTMSFVAAAVALGAFSTEEECVEWIRANYGGARNV